MPNEDKPRDEWLEKITAENCPRFERKSGVQYFGPAFSEECSEILRSFIPSPDISDAVMLSMAYPNKPYILGWDPAKLGSERTVFADGLTLRHKEDGTTEVECGPFKPAEPGEEVEWKSADGSTYMVHASTKSGAGDYKPVYSEWSNWHKLVMDGLDKASESLAKAQAACDKALASIEAKEKELDNG